MSTCSDCMCSLDGIYRHGLQKKQSYWIMSNTYKREQASFLYNSIWCLSLDIGHFLCRQQQKDKSISLPIVHACQVINIIGYNQLTWFNCYFSSVTMITRVVNWRWRNIFLKSLCNGKEQYICKYVEDTWMIITASTPEKVPCTLHGQVYWPLQSFLQHCKTAISPHLANREAP